MQLLGEAHSADSNAASMVSVGRLLGVGKVESALLASIVFRTSKVMAMAWWKWH